MGRQRFLKTIRLLIKLMLLFQIYFYHCFKAKATENNFPESFDKDKMNEETGLNAQICDNDIGLSHVGERPKRPARLIPLKMLL